MEPYLLQAEELKELVVKIPDWEINNAQIQREFKFSNFIEAFSFMTKVALICEKYNHHPNWENVYSKVIIRLARRSCRATGSASTSQGRSIWSTGRGPCAVQPPSSGSASMRGSECDRRAGRGGG